VHRKHAILADSIAVLAHGPRVVAAAGHLHQAAEGGDGIGVALRVDEGEPHGHSLATYFAAYLRMSRSIWSRLISRRSLASPARSSLVMAPAGPLPASTSAHEAAKPAGSR
jgi:hypothetical protein